MFRTAMLDDRLSNCPGWLATTVVVELGGLMSREVPPIIVRLFLGELLLSELRSRVPRSPATDELTGPTSVVIRDEKPNNGIIVRDGGAYLTFLGV